MRVELLVTDERARRDYPDPAYSSSPRARPGVVSALYKVAPEKCATELGRWLASHITCTRLDHDGSLCQIVLPLTEEDVHFREFGLRLATRTAILSPADAEGRVHPDARIDRRASKAHAALPALGVLAPRDQVRMAHLRSG